MLSDKFAQPHLQTIQSVHQLFELAASEFPESKALIFGDQSITYHDLNIRSTAMAGFILNQAPEVDIIGISTTRSIDMIVALLAILKAGKAYLPLDPGYPEQRLKQIVTDSKVAFCIAEK